MFISMWYRRHEVTEGSLAPPFTLKDQDGKTVNLSKFKGKPVVVYFYPTDETPGCTKQACAFRDSYEKFKKAGAQVVGISGDGSESHKVKIWDPSLRGSELRATLKGHTRTVRAISSDRGKVVSELDDQSVLVWDKQTTQLLEELKGHDAQVSVVRMLSGERVLTAAHDGTVKMWDV